MLGLVMERGVRPVGDGSELAAECVGRRGAGVSVPLVCSVTLVEVAMLMLLLLEVLPLLLVLALLLLERPGDGEGADTEGRVEARPLGNPTRAVVVDAAVAEDVDMVEAGCEFAMMDDRDMPLCASPALDALEPAARDRLCACVAGPGSCAVWMLRWNEDPSVENALPAGCSGLIWLSGEARRVREPPLREPPLRRLPTAEPPVGSGSGAALGVGGAPGRTGKPLDVPKRLREESGISFPAAVPLRAPVSREGELRPVRLSWRGVPLVGGAPSAGRS